MQLILARHLWGVSAPYFPELKKFKEQGYSAIETGLLYSAEPRDQLVAQIQELDMQWIPMIFTHGKSVDEHLTSFVTQIKEIAPYRPMFINAHSGRDAFTRAEASKFYNEALKIEDDTGIPVSHETHRSRTFYNPWTTRDLLQEFPDLKLCCDYSHWVNVCERLLNDEHDILKLCAERCLHIHARIGYEQGPQVPDPRAPEYQSHVDAHERWWDMIWDAQKKSGRTYSTLTPEFGPAPYLQLQPYTNEPAASLEEICLWQMERQKGRFEKRISFEKCKVL